MTHHPRTVAATAVTTLAISVMLVFGGGAAWGALSHRYLPSVSEAMDQGVPAGSPVAMTGPLQSARASVADAGEVWVADGDTNAQRIDKYDAASGAFVSPNQLDEGKGLLENFGFAGIAVGRYGGSERVYVTAGKEGKVEIVAYSPPSKEPSAVWSGAGTEEGSFAGLLYEGRGKEAVAVDDSGDPETSGDLYVASKEGPKKELKGVYAFVPGSGGGEPSKPLATITGTCASAGVCSGAEVIPFTGPEGVAVSGFNGDVLVTDGEAEACSRGEAECGVDVFEPVAAMPGVYSYLFKIHEVGGVPLTQIGQVGVDALTGNIYVTDEGAVDEFSSTGAFLGRIAGTPTGVVGTLKPFPSITSIAVDSTTGNVFVATADEHTSRVSMEVFDRGVVVPDVSSELPSEVTPRSARLNGKVDPDGEGEATCRFAWSVGTTLDRTAACEPKTLPNGSTPVEVHARLEGLEPDTEYCSRLQAANKNGENVGEPSQDECFTTSGPAVGAASVADVSATSATLLAGIVPHGRPTSYYFQYGRSEAYEAQVAAPVSIGSGESGVEVEQRVQGLLPSTTYHYRVVAISEIEPGTPETFVSPDQTFTTQPPGSAGTLLDGRQWELVSPADKRGALFGPNSDAATQAAVNGTGMTYTANVPTEAGAPGYQYLGVQVLSRRTQSGWVSKDLSLPHSTLTAEVDASGREYRFFSPDLASAVLEPYGAFTSLAPEAFPPDSDRTTYLRHNSSCEQTPSTCYEPLVTAASGYADVPEGTPFGGVFETTPTKKTSEAKFAGASPDLSHVILSSAVSLTGAATGQYDQLYEWSAGAPPTERLKLVSVLPSAGSSKEEMPAQGNPVLGAQYMARNAVSEDGSRVFWTETKGNGSGSVLYMRDVADGHTIRLDVPQAACVSGKECGEGPEAPEYQTASVDGSRVFFKDQQRLTADAGRVPRQRDLYECVITEQADGPQCALTDLTPAPSGEEAADVQGKVIEASSDGSWVYFVANGILGDGRARGATVGDCLTNTNGAGGVCNLYVWHDGTISFIAVLPGEDNKDWAGLPSLTARVSPNGEWLAFMSERSLTGYDNRDAVSGKPDEEVYLYHASGSGSLVCGSCDPTGARPHGIEYQHIAGKLSSGFPVWEADTWIGAIVPTWTQFQQEDGIYQPRYLSDQGRLFFNSSDALSASDINGEMDAYEFEPVGVGDCTAASQGYSEHANGCVELVSSGTATGESAFLDASETGDDVFFLTKEKLVGADIDTALDVYDAHVCSETAPCAPPASPSPACTTAEACRAAPEPQPVAFGAPASATFSGTGNLSAASTTATVKPRSSTQAQQLTRALAQCRRKKAKRKRIGCERVVRHRYAGKSARNGTKKGTGR
jgi:hypothetical protein